jgi:hypothetical protein
MRDRRIALSVISLLPLPLSSRGGEGGTTSPEGFMAVVRSQVGELEMSCAYSAGQDARLYGRPEARRYVLFLGLR